MLSAMGWHGGHLHAFFADGIEYGVPDPEFDLFDRPEPERRYRLWDVLSRPGRRIRYEYDFGDDWDHEVLMEKELPADPALKYPACVAGRRRCPPEDCGGVWGYAELLATLAYPSREDHEEMLEWAGGPIDPDEFSVDRVKNRLSHLQRRPGR